MSGFADRENKRGSIIRGMIQNQGQEARAEVKSEAKREEEEFKKAVEKPARSKRTGKKKVRDTSDEAKSHYTFSIPTSLMEDVRTIVFVTNDNMSAVVVDAFKKYVEDNKQILEVMAPYREKIESEGF